MSWLIEGLKNTFWTFYVFFYVEIITSIKLLYLIVI